MGQEATLDKGKFVGKVCITVKKQGGIGGMVKSPMEVDKLFITQVGNISGIAA